MKENWMPLESNPFTINPYLLKLGVRTEEVCFQELLGVEDWAQGVIEGTVLGVIMLFDETKVQNEYKKLQEESINLEAVPESLFYMKQFAHNACGSIAIFHVFLNLITENPHLLQEKSPLSNFFMQTKSKNYLEKGKDFEESKEIKALHKEAAGEGQSEIQSEVNTHFTAFVLKESCLWELDGEKKGPVNLGYCESNEILQKSCLEIQKYMNRDPENLNFSILVLTTCLEN